MSIVVAPAFASTKEGVVSVENAEAQAFACMVDERIFVNHVVESPFANTAENDGHARLAKIVNLKVL